jgi:hypothetical protein
MQKGWCFTLNNYSQEDCERIKDYAHGNYKTLIKKIIVGKEIAPNTGMPHLQGYIKFTRKTRLWGVRSLFQGKAHWEAAEGSEQSNLKYCTKGGDVLVELGFRAEKVTALKNTAQQGNNYWQAVVQDAYTLGVEDFAEKWPKEWLLRRGAVERLMLDAAKKQMRVWPGNLQHKNVWIWGKPGIGKSRWAHRQETGGDTLFKNLNRWWDGMDVKAVTKVLIEDFPCPAYDGMAHLLKIWGDRYTFTGEVKNSAIAIDPGRFFLIVTSNFHPSVCFNKQEDIEAIQRRFAVIQMTEGNARFIERVRLNPEILTKPGSTEEEEEAEGEEIGPIALEEALLALEEEPENGEIERAQYAVQWRDGEVEKQDSQGKWQWKAGKGFVKDGNQ